MHKKNNRNRRLKVHAKSKSSKNNKKSQGKIRPLILAILIIISGILLDQWWWQIGLIMLVALFIGGYYRYRTPY